MTGISDKGWRLKSLYSIKRADTGQRIAFIPRREQTQIFDALIGGARRIIIIKARRLGMSTGIGVYSADAIAFNAGFQISIVDRNQAEASLKLNNIVKIAFRSLPDAVKLAYGRPKTDSGSCFEIESPGTLPSAIYAGKNARGGTNQLLHISEWGVIQFEDPPRSTEILTGALPSAEHGVTIIETTWQGGRGGDLWNLVQMALRREPVEPTDWRLFFFPWWRDPTYVRKGSLAEIPPEITDYLNDRESELGIHFSDEQRIWYAAKKEEQGLYMWREFPSTFEECFRAPVEGAIYADRVDRLRYQGRIREIVPDFTTLVHTFWDLGAPSNMVTWFVQFLPDGTFRVIDCMAEMDITPAERIARIYARGWPLGMHYLPHDAEATQKSGKTFHAEMLELGLTNVRIVPRIKDIWIGINYVRSIFDRFEFRIPQCERGVEALSCYHKKAMTATGSAVEEPVHDWSSHFADGLRMLGECDMHGMLSRHATGGVTVRTGISDRGRPPERSPIDIFFDEMKPRVRVIR